jgi:hypothetical protein
MLDGTILSDYAKDPDNEDPDASGSLTQSLRCAPVYPRKVDRLGRFICDKAQWHGHGSGDLPLDYRSSRRTAVGCRVRAAGCSLSIYDPR